MEDCKAWVGCSRSIDRQPHTHSTPAVAALLTKGTVCRVWDVGILREHDFEG